ncbi:MAG: hypothetical protein GYA36_20050 [Veillonellaceae bacterium]|nr:hypothetical protein [Veillonellaceae bacterium]
MGICFPGISHPRWRTSPRLLFARRFLYLLLDHFPWRNYGEKEEALAEGKWRRYGFSENFGEVLEKNFQEGFDSVREIDFLFELEEKAITKKHVLWKKTMLVVVYGRS